MMQFWLGFWDFREVTEWSLIRLTHTLIETMASVVGAMILLSGRIISKELDLEAFYLPQSKLFFVLAIITLVSSGLADIRILSLPLLHSEKYVRLCGAARIFDPMLNTDKKLHYAFPLISIVMLVVFLTTGQQRDSRLIH